MQKTYKFYLCQQNLWFIESNALDTSTNNKQVNSFLYKHPVI